MTTSDTEHLWEKAGGIFIHHTSAEESIERLASLGLPVRRTVA